VEQEYQKWQSKSPLFMNELKNLLLYMTEKGYTEDEKSNILIGEKIVEEEGLKNEIESIRSIYSTFYNEFMALLKNLNEDELELLIVLLESK
jgi:hypothetical protein